MPLFHLPSPPVPHLRLMNSILSRSLLSRTPSLLTNSRALSSRTTFPTTSSIFTHPPFVAQPPRSRSLSFSPFTTAVMPVQTLPTPPPKTVKLALCQIHVTAEKDANIATAIEAVTEAADHGASIVVLPEMWNCPYANASFPIFAEDIEHGPAPSSGILAMLAKARGITIIGGSIPERKGDKLFNTCCVFGPNGALLAKHRKTHLFDIDIPGKMTFKESVRRRPRLFFLSVPLFFLDFFFPNPSPEYCKLQDELLRIMLSAGHADGRRGPHGGGIPGRPDRPRDLLRCVHSAHTAVQCSAVLLFHLNWISSTLSRISMCVLRRITNFNPSSLPSARPDMRFPEMAMLYARKGVQLIVYPGAFNMVTGPLHWELLQRARALDNQVRSTAVQFS